MFVHNLKVRQFSLTYRWDLIKCYHSGINGNKEVLSIPQSSSISGASPSDYLMSHQDTHWGVLPLYRDAVSIFCSPCRLGQKFWQLQPTGQRRFNVISRALIWGVLPLYRDAVSIFYSPCRLGQKFWLRQSWLNSYHCIKWTWQLVFKPSTRLFAFQIAWVFFKNIWIQLFSIYCPVSWGCRIHELLLCRGVWPP